MAKIRCTKVHQGNLTDTVTTKNVTPCHISNQSSTMNCKAVAIYQMNDSTLYRYNAIRMPLRRKLATA
jgi:hypothetical protein